MTTEKAKTTERPSTLLEGFDNVQGGFSAKWLWPLFKVSDLAPWNNFGLHHRVYVIPDGEGRGGWLVASSGAGLLAIRDETAWGVGEDKKPGPVSIRISEGIGMAGKPRYSPDLHDQGDTWNELLPGRYQPDVFTFFPLGAYVSPKDTDEDAPLCYSESSGWEPRNRTDRGGFRTHGKAELGVSMLKMIQGWAGQERASHGVWPCHEHLAAFESVGAVLGPTRGFARRCERDSIS